jgi:type II secretory pathway pseudopilin PulG
MKYSGFTLIETILYCALLSVLMTGTIVTVFTLLESSRYTAHQTAIITEMSFIDQKMTWLLKGASTVTVIDSQTLLIQRPDLGTQSPLTLSADNETLLLTQGTEGPLPLTGLPYRITNVDITYVDFLLTMNYHINGIPFRFQANLE